MGQVAVIFICYLTRDSSVEASMPLSIPSDKRCHAHAPRYPVIMATNARMPPRSGPVSRLAATMIPARMAPQSDQIRDSRHVRHAMSIRSAGNRSASVPCSATVSRSRRRYKNAAESVLAALIRAAETAARLVVIVGYKAFNVVATAASHRHPFSIIPSFHCSPVASTST